MSRLIDVRSWYVWCFVFLSLGCTLFFLIHLSQWLDQKTYAGVTLTVLLLFLFVGVLLLIYSEHFGLFYSLGKGRGTKKFTNSSESDTDSHVIDINDLPDCDPEFAPPPAYDDETTGIAPPPYSHAVCDQDEEAGPTQIET